jgi:hypothetical protein
MTKVDSLDHPIVLATDYPPTAGGGGAVMLRSLIEGPQRAGILWTSLSALERETLGALALTRGSTGLKSLIKKRSTTLDIALCHRLAAELQSLAVERRARGFWIVMHGAMVHVAARLMKITRLPVHLTIHDDPVAVTLMSKRYLPLLPLVYYDFAFAMRRATSVDVVGEAMARHYKQAFGVDSVVVHRGLEGPIPEPRVHVDSDALEVGVLGNTYGYRQLPEMAAVVERTASLLKRRARVVVMGQGLGERLRADMGSRIEVEVTGHLNESAAVERLQRCFCLYLNYPFSSRFSLFRRTSFPTKLTTYLMAARPLLVNAPMDTSIAFLASLPAYAAWWGNKSIDAGVAELQRLWESPAAHGSQQATAENIRRTYFDKATNQAQLFQALGIH